jgi:hypothetical protein
MAWAYGALPWLGALLGLALLLVLVCRWPIRLDVNARARGEPDGGWVMAGGASLSVLAMAFVGGRGVPARLTFFLFGRKLGWKPDWRSGEGEPPQKPKQDQGQRERLLSRGLRRVWKRVDPLGLATQLLSERRHFRVRYLVFDLEYGFRDPLLTGRLVGALAALSGVLPAPIEIRQRPRWDFEDGWAVQLDGRAVVKPWLVLLDLGVYVLRQMASRAARVPEPLPAAGPNELR